MIDLVLPGRDAGPEDWEAQSALRNLLETEKFKHCGDEDLYARVSEQLRYNIDMLNRVSALVDGLMTEDDGGEEPTVGRSNPSERTDTRDISDFLTRINRARRVEAAKNNQPLKGSRYG